MSETENIGEGAKRIDDFDSTADLVAYAQANPQAWIVCPDCDRPDSEYDPYRDPCDYCGSEGYLPAWRFDPAMYPDGQVYQG